MMTVILHWIEILCWMYQFYLMKHNRAKSTQHCTKFNKNQLINPSLPFTNTMHSIFKPSITTHPNNIHNIQFKNNAQLVKNVIDDYFQTQQPFQKTMPLLNRHRHYQHHRTARRAKLTNQLAPLQSTASLNYSPNKHRVNALSVLQYNRQRNRQQHALLPPINQLSQDCQQPKQINTSLMGSNMTSTSFYFRRSSSVFSQYLNPQMEIKQTRVKSYQNQIFTIYIILQNGHPIGRLKQFKQAGESVLMRELKMASFNAMRVWQQSKINPVTFQTGMDQPLKDMLCKMKQDELNPSQLRIYPRSLHKKLKANDCQQLKILLRNLCIDMLKLKGKVINNKVNLTNLFIKDDKFVLAEWGHSSFRETFDIQLSTFQTRQKGHLQGQHGWLVSPEYLAPEIIAEIMGEQVVDVWQMQSSPDIWSLGLVLLQILTLIPVWCVNGCFVLGRVGVCRPGILGIAGRQLHKLHQRQFNIQRSIKKCIDLQLQPNSQFIGNLILKMVDPNPKTRITYQQIIDEL